jgi:hypothetical protein
VGTMYPVVSIKRFITNHFEIGEKSKDNYIYMCHNFSMRRLIKAAVAPGEFKCRTCEILWSSFMENNIPCIDRSMRSGLHNFDFSKPIALEKTQPDLF